METITIYTDGSSLKSGDCGWAYKVIRADGRTYSNSGSLTRKSSTYTELYAAYMALKSIKGHHRVVLYSGCTYVVERLNDNTRKSIKKCLGKRLFDEINRIGDVEAVWVKGHGNDEHNIEVDKAARAAARKRVNK